MNDAEAILAGGHAPTAEEVAKLAKKCARERQHEVACSLLRHRIKMDENGGSQGRGVEAIKHGRKQGLPAGDRRATGQSGPAPVMEAIKHFFSERDQFAKHSGIELVSVAPGRAQAKMVLCQHHWNGVDLAHGGAIFTLADFAFAAASNSHGTIAVAINVSISFLKAASTGTLWADAREVSLNPKLGSYTVDVKDDAGQLVAVFQGLAYRKKDKLPIRS
jgi:acyl-CoA thioesterase